MSVCQISHCVHTKNHFGAHNGIERSVYIQHMFVLLSACGEFEIEPQRVQDSYYSHSHLLYAMNKRTAIYNSTACI